MSLQVQATVVGFLAAVAAVILGWIPEGKYRLDHAILLCSSSVATAFIASLLQGKPAATIEEIKVKHRSEHSIKISPTIYQIYDPSNCFKL